jgi:mono/diheme cytochrome c family protein
MPMTGNINKLYFCRQFNKTIIMKRFRLLQIILFSSAVVFSSCGGGGQKESSQSPASSPKEDVKAPANSELTAQLQLGENIYKTKCIVCHQADAKGVAGTFPPLAGSDYLLADPRRGIAQTLNGSNIEMLVNGTTYKTPMIPQVQTKEEAVAVVNYVLKTFNGFTDDKLLTMEDAKDIAINPIKL